MSDLDKRIKETKRLLSGYDLMPLHQDPIELIMRNQVEIMEALIEIKKEISVEP